MRRQLDRSDAADIRDMLGIVTETRSQFMQELFALAVAGGKKTGFFVEFGACDGLHLSNTSVLEKIGWNGILSEPARAWHAALRSNRTAIIDCRCVAAGSDQELVFSEAEEPGQSALVTRISPDVEIVQRYSVQTVSLLDLLRTHNAPHHIDYLSIDTEGNEADILGAFDFSEYTFGFISTEQHSPTGPVSDILDNAGYRVLFPRKPNVNSLWSQVTGFDMWYVPKTYSA